MSDGAGVVIGLLAGLGLVLLVAWLLIEMLDQDHD